MHRLLTGATSDNASAVNLTTRDDVRATVKKSKKENDEENKDKNSFRILRVLLIWIRRSRAAILEMNIIQENFDF